MNIEKSTGPRLLPDDYSLDRLDSHSFMGKLFSRASEYLEDNEALKTFYWTIRLMLASRPIVRFVRPVIGFRFLGFGFLDPELEEDNFGVIVFATNPNYGKPFFLEPIELEEKSFPVVVRPFIEIPHWPSIHLSLGRCGCWAETRMSSNSVGPGGLTAKHCVSGLTMGSKVPLTDGTWGTLLDIAPEGIDAAIVATGETPGSTILKTEEFVTPYTDVEFEGASGPVKTKITAVTDTFGILSSPVLPSRVALARSGAHGDSGAIVKSIPLGRAVGIYMGAYTDTAGRYGGLAQTAHQVALTMDGRFLQ
ncbi:MAG: hypothetical protein A4E64_02890 [Syntrophorhabdus sp. PtaU1.Bin058]|nr:MAG: hypothetical protein A4E64_02890 [Syntrophorhabdus sp. PtaU1.Bin058]